MATRIEQSHQEAFDLLCGKLLGRGMSRNVFECKLLPDCVVKVENDEGFFQNIKEWETWQRIKYTKHSAWFAECSWISGNGQILIMEKTVPCYPKDLPEMVPAYLTDLKSENFGMSQLKDPKTGEVTNRFVCHDYGSTLLMEKGMTSKMKKADWWS